MTDRRKETAEAKVTMVNIEHDQGLLDLGRRSDRGSMLFPFLCLVVGSIVATAVFTPVPHSIEDGFALTAKSLGSHNSSCFVISVRR